MIPIDDKFVAAQIQFRQININAMQQSINAKRELIEKLQNQQNPDRASLIQQHENDIQDNKMYIQKLMNEIEEIKQAPQRQIEERKRQIQEREQQRQKAIQDQQEMHNKFNALTTAQNTLIQKLDSLPADSKFKTLRQQVHALNNKINNLKVIKENHDKTLLEHYCCIISAVTNALFDKSKIAPLKEQAQEIQNSHYRPNTGLRVLVGLILMIVGTLTTLYCLATGTAPVAAVGGLSGLYLFYKGYGSYSHGAEQFPAGEMVRDIAESIDKFSP